MTGNNIHLRNEELLEPDLMMLVNIQFPNPSENLCKQPNLNLNTIRIL